MPSSSGFSRTLVIEPPPGWRVPLLLAIVSVLAWIAIGLSGLPWPASMALAGMVAGTAAWEAAAARPGGPRSVTTLSITGTGRILLACGHEVRPCRAVCPGRFWILSAGMTPGLMMGLELIAADGRRFRLILFPDQCDATTWRRLVVRLRLGGQTAGTRPQ